MKILLFGANGQVGSELKHSLRELGVVMAFTRNDIDLSDFDTVRELVVSLSPDVIINAAAYTDVEKAESELGLARTVNAEAVNVLAKAAKNINSWLLHYSTDYVFDGSKGGEYFENDIPNPLNNYGLTKFWGEQAIHKSGCKYVIFRTSWVVSLHGKNFVKTILRLAQEKETLSIVADQYGVPTSAKFIAKATYESIEKITSETLPGGIYHLVPQGEATWYEFACFIIKTAKEYKAALKLNEEDVKSINTSDYSTIAKRPMNSKLNNNKLRGMLSLRFPHWKDEVKEIVQVLLKERFVL